MIKILAILGPTATGKTDLALDLARKYQGELIACDSRQVYIGLDIGTGKMPSDGRWDVRSGKKKWEVGGVTIWMYDVADPKVQYTVADYVKDASKIINDIHQRGKLPIIVGGTGLYLKALLLGLPNLAVPINQTLRRELESLSLEELQSRLKQLSPSRWESLNESDKQNPRRLLRSIELISMNPYMDKARNPKSEIPKFDALKIGLTTPRDQLYKNIDSRVSSRINQGMVREAQSLQRSGLSLQRMKQLGLEYGVLADYLDGKIKTIDELIKIMQGKIHGYARRQLTWFKKEPDVEWFDISKKDWSKKVEKKANDWYNAG